MNEFSLVPVKEKQSEKHPDFIVQFSKRVGSVWNRTRIGSAWKNKTKNGMEIINVKLNEKPYKKSDGNTIPAYKVVIDENSLVATDDEKQINVKDIPF